MCQCCKKHHAAKSYEGEKDKREFYCLDCYSRLFLDGGSGEENALPACPYCGTGLDEVKKSKLVGCAHCYQSMQTGLFPMVKKMQGGRAHTGKTPPMEGEYGSPYVYGDMVYGEYRARAVARARYARQYRELEIIIAHLHAEGREAEASGYEEKLAAMRVRGTIEEDFVWRTRTSLSKQS